MFYLPMTHMTSFLDVEQQSDEVLSGGLARDYADLSSIHTALDPLSKLFRGIERQSRSFIWFALT